MCKNCNTIGTYTNLCSICAIKYQIENNTEIEPNKEKGRIMEKMDEVFKCMERLYGKTKKEVGLIDGESYVYAKHNLKGSFVFYMPFVKDEESLKRGIEKLLHGSYKGGI